MASIMFEPRSMGPCKGVPLKIASAFGNREYEPNGSICARSLNSAASVAMALVPGDGAGLVLGDGATVD